MTVIDLPRPAVADRLWTADAACARPDAPTGLWWADNATARAAALHVCLTHCPVLAECDTEAQAYRGSEDRYRSVVVGGAVYNVAGARSTPKPESRCPMCSRRVEWPLAKNQRERRPGRQPAPCGTEAAYSRHRRRGEPVDEACRVAHTTAGLPRKREQRRLCRRGQCPHPQHRRAVGT